MKNYMDFGYVTGYFLGSHGNIISLFFFATILILGTSKITKTKSMTTKFFSIIAFFVALTTYIYSIKIQPLFHLRSLQILGLAIIFLYALGLKLIPWHKYKVFLILIILILGINFFYVVKLIINQPRKLLIDFFPWKNVYTKINLYKIKTIYYKVNNNIAIPILENGLKYTFSGKEVLFGKKYHLNKLSANQSLPLNCPLIQTGLISIYGCR